MPVHHRVTPSIKFTGTHLYTWVEKGTARVECLAQEHNTMSLSSTLTMRPPRLPISCWGMMQLPLTWVKVPHDWMAMWGLARYPDHYRCPGPTLECSWPSSQQIHPVHLLVDDLDYLVGGRSPNFVQSGQSLKR